MSNVSFVNGKATIKWITFSDGTETCKIVEGRYNSEVNIAQPLESDNLTKIQCNIEDGTRDLIRIGLVKDALNNLGIRDVTLHLPYVPQARADRVFEYGNPLPIKVFANILNSYNFTKVIIEDPHSDVTSALINNVQVVGQTQLLKRNLPYIKSVMKEDFQLCAPDLGATKKIFDTVQELGHKDYIQAVKIRDVTTGEIVKCDLTIDKVEGDVMIVDDISDNGMSFYFLADKLKQKGAKNVGLYVTHAIFPNGLDKIGEKIDYIFTENLVGGKLTREMVDNFYTRNNKGEK